MRTNISSPYICTCLLILRKLNDSKTRVFNEKRFLWLVVISISYSSGTHFRGLSFGGRYHGGSSSGSWGSKINGGSSFPRENPSLFGSGRHSSDSKLSEFVQKPSIVGLNSFARENPSLFGSRSDTSDSNLTGGTSRSSVLSQYLLSRRNQSGGFSRNDSSGSNLIGGTSRSSVLSQSLLSKGNRSGGGISKSWVNIFFVKTMFGNRERNWFFLWFLVTISRKMQHS